MTYTDDDVRRLALSEARQELLEEIMSTPTLETIDEAGRPSRKRPRWVPAAAAAAAVLVAVAVPVWIGRDDKPTSGDSPYAAAILEIAEGSNRVLIDEPGWAITYVDGFGDAEGEMTFEKEGRALDVHWRAADSYDSFVEDRAHGNAQEPVTVLGEDSLLFTYGDGEYTTIRPADGASFLEIRGGVGDKAAYLALLAKLTFVDVQTWLDALPREVVLPEERDDSIQGILEGIPVPTGFQVQSSDDISERYHVIADVTGQVTCAWIEVWLNGDQQTKDEALAALLTFRQWPALLEIKDQGGWSDAVFQTVSELGRGHVNPEYKQGLGCD